MKSFQRHQDISQLLILENCGFFSDRKLNDNCDKFVIYYFFKLCDAELLSVHTHEENDFITKQLRKSSDVNKLWIGMSYKEKVRMWSWIDGSRYR